MARAYRVISGDSHLEVRADRWTHRVPAKHQDQAPAMVTLADGADGIVVPGAEPAHNPMDLYGGRGREQWRPYGERYEDTPGTGPPEQRVQEQDQDGVDAEVLYPSANCGAKIWEKIKDVDAQIAVFRAYNDWLAEEYCAAAPDRLFGIGTIPSTGIDDAVAELEHCAEAGLTGIVLDAFPNGSGRPKPEDDRFWAVAVERAVPVSIHVSIRSAVVGVGKLVDYPQKIPEYLHTDLAVQMSRFGRAGAANVIQLILAGVFDRFPGLRFNMSENQIGWVPFFMDTADIRYNRHIGWTEDILGFKPLKRLPSEYIREHFYWGFQEDRPGVELRHYLGADRLIWGADFPHVESEWPHSQRVLAANFDGVSKQEAYLMACGNAIDFFRIAR